MQRSMDTTLPKADRQPQDQPPRHLRPYRQYIQTSRPHVIRYKEIRRRYASRAGGTNRRCSARSRRKQPGKGPALSILPSRSDKRMSCKFGHTSDRHSGKRCTAWSYISDQNCWGEDLRGGGWYIIRFSTALRGVSGKNQAAAIAHIQIIKRSLLRE